MRKIEFTFRPVTAIRYPGGGYWTAHFQCYHAAGPTKESAAESLYSKMNLQRAGYRSGEHIIGQAVLGVSCSVSVRDTGDN